MMLKGFYLAIVLAIKITLGVSIGATIIGLCLGILNLFLVKLPIVGKVVILWNKLIRGIPEILILFAIYFGLASFLSHMMGKYIDINPLLAGIAALSIIFSAYALQIFRAALTAIDSGGIDAALALGMNRFVVFYKIILPQLWQHALPGLFNLWVVILKDSSIVSVIGLKEIMNQAQIASTQQFEPFYYYLFAGCIYLILTASSQFLAKCIEKEVVG